MSSREVWLEERVFHADPLLHLVFCTLEQVRREVVPVLDAMAEEQLWASPGGATPIGFHLRHIGESLDRLLTYAEGESLNSGQLDSLGVELGHELPRDQIKTLLFHRLADAERRLHAIRPARFAETRYIGRRRVPVPLGTLIGHLAEHTQRHLGQIRTTAKLLGLA